MRHVAVAGGRRTVCGWEEPMFAFTSFYSSVLSSVTRVSECTPPFRVKQGSWQAVRNVRMSSGDDEVADLIERSIVKPKKESPEEVSRRLTSTRKEALSLYRQVLRTSRLFVWRNEHGMVWRDVIQSSARQEFEAARFERDPEMVARLLVGGRDAVQAAVDKFLKRREDIMEADKDTFRSG